MITWLLLLNWNRNEKTINPKLDLNQHRLGAARPLIQCLGHQYAVTPFSEKLLKRAENVESHFRKRLLPKPARRQPKMLLKRILWKTKVRKRRIRKKCLLNCCSLESLFKLAFLKSKVLSKIDGLTCRSSSNGGTKIFQIKLRKIGSKSINKDSKLIRELKVTETKHWKEQNFLKK